MTVSEAIMIDLLDLKNLQKALMEVETETSITNKYLFFHSIIQEHCRQQ